MLCLQNGRFDHPDRMFNSIPQENDQSRRCQVPQMNERELNLIVHFGTDNNSITQVITQITFFENTVRQIWFQDMCLV